MWSNIVKKKENPSDLNDNNKPKKIIKTVIENNQSENINIFESYHSSKCIDFIMDIKKNLNIQGFKILDKENFNLTKNFIDFIQLNVICSEEDDLNREESNDELENNDDYFFDN